MACAIVLGGGTFLVRTFGQRASDPPVAATTTTGAASEDHSSHSMAGMSHGTEGMANGADANCQTSAHRCSYLELKAAVTSGAEVPPSWHMTREELRALVSQLDTVSRHLERYKSGIDQACVDGYEVKSPQTPNMGIHMVHRDYSGRDGEGIFDLNRPEILLFATPSEGAEKLSQREIGDCAGGKWTGDPQQQIVGAAFLLSGGKSGTSAPEGFSGPLDKWHYHNDVCFGLADPATLPKEECERRGGTYLASSEWMIHVYAVPAFDSALGVFSEWNPSIWPTMTAAELAAIPWHDMSMGMSGPPGAK